MFLLLLLVGTSAWASQPLVPSNKCRDLVDLASPVSPLAVQTRDRNLVLGNLPEDLRERMLAAQIGKVDVDKGTPSLNTWNLTGVRNLQMMGVNPDKIREIVRARLHSFYEVPRQLKAQGAPDLTDSLAKLPADSHLPVEARRSLGHFMEGYQLNDIADMKKQAGGRRWQSLIELDQTISLRHAFNLARSIGDTELQMEALRLALNFHNWREAMHIAETLGSDDALLMLAKLQLTDFLEPSGRQAHRAGDIHEVVEALKRIQGPKKAEAEMMLWDLARELASPSFREEMAKLGHSPAEIADSFDVYVLRSLRSMGTIAERVPVDSEKWEFRTRVDSPEVRTQIQKQVDRIMTETPFNNTYTEILESLVAIGDPERLNQYGDLILSLKDKAKAQTRNTSRFINTARDFYIAGGEMHKAQSLIREELALAIKNSDSDALSDELPHLALKMNDKTLLAEIRAALVKATEKDEAQAARHLRNFDELVRNGLPTYQPHLQTDSQMIDRVIVRAVTDETEIQKTLNRARASTPEERAAKNQAAEEQLKHGDLWQAYLLFADGLNREGLIRVADRMIAQDPFHAEAPLLAAALLRPENLLSAPKE